MNYPAANYLVSEDNIFCHSVLDTESRKTGFPLSLESQERSKLQGIRPKEIKKMESQFAASNQNQNWTYDEHEQTKNKKEGEQPV